jgi:hypothetical protein
MSSYLVGRSPTGRLNDAAAVNDETNSPGWDLLKSRLGKRRKHFGLAGLEATLLVRLQHQLQSLLNQLVGSSASESLKALTVGSVVIDRRRTVLEPEVVEQSKRLVREAENFEGIKKSNAFLRVHSLPNE